MSATTYSPGYGGSAVMAEEIDGDDADRMSRGKVDVGEETGRQDYVNLFGTVGMPNGGSPGNPCGYPGYGQLYLGTFPTYRLIRRHPQVAHVRRQVMGPITYNGFGWEVSKNAPAGAEDAVKEVFTPELVRYAKSHACLALDYGCMGFEIVWELVKGQYRIARLKPLSVDTLGIVVRKDTGQLAGLRYGSGNAMLERRKSFLFTYGQAQGGEAGNPWGESRFENIRETCWRDWLDASQQLMFITQKIAGKLAIITSPGGSYKVKLADGTETYKSYRDAAMAAGAAIADPRSNGTVWMPTAALPNNIRADNMELMKYPMVQIQVVDFGSHSEAIVGTLERMKHNEGLMSAGYLRSPRTNQESDHGSRADADRHTDTDTVDLEGIDQDFFDALNAQCVDAFLEINYGPDARGTIRANPAKMRDDTKAIDDKLIDAALTDDELRPQALTQADMDAVFKRRGSPVLGNKALTLTLDTTNVDDENDEPPPPGRRKPDAEPEDDDEADDEADDDDEE